MLLDEYFDSDVSVANDITLPTELSITCVSPRHYSIEFDHAPINPNKIFHFTFLIISFRCFQKSFSDFGVYAVNDVAKWALQAR